MQTSSSVSQAPSPSPSQRHGTVPTAPVILKLCFSLLIAVIPTLFTVPISMATKVLFALSCLILASLLYFFSPFHKQMQHYKLVNNLDIRTNIQQLLPLFPVWLLTMLLPLLTINSIPVTSLVLLGTTTYLYWMFPVISGQRALQN